jgi:DNA polymerase III alpha subunit (gram-positive type)
MLVNKLLVIDIETTGFNHKTDCILELGIVELDIESGQIVELLDLQIKEKHLSAKHHNAWIFENGYMNHDDVRNAKSLETHFNKIQTIFNNYLDKICAWNRSFDVDFLKSRGFNLGKDIPDPMKASASFFNLPYPYSKKLGKWPSAQEAWDRLFPETKKTELHRGLDDAKMEAKIIYELVKKNVYTF